MDGAPFTDFAASIRYALTHRPTADHRVEIVLDLYRGAVPVLTRSIAHVEPGDAAPVLTKCHRYLERRGAHAVAHAAMDVPYASTRGPAEDPRHAAPVAAFDWMFAG